MKRLAAAVSLLALGNLYAPIVALGQPACADGSSLSGQVRDTTAAIIPGASVTLDGRPPVVADSAGRFRFACLGAGRHALHVAANSFATLDIAVTAPRQGELIVTLHPQKVETIVDVGADSGHIEEDSATASGPSDDSEPSGPTSRNTDTPPAASVASASANRTACRVWPGQ